jgi:hypothetical protein
MNDGERLWRHALAMTLLMALAGCQPTMAVGETRVVAATQRWQHYCLVEPDVTFLNHKLAELGNGGWELAAGVPSDRGGVWCLKRPR